MNVIMISKLLCVYIIIMPLISIAMLAGLSPCFWKVSAIALASSDNWQPPNFMFISVALHCMNCSSLNFKTASICIHWYSSYHFPSLATPLCLSSLIWWLSLDQLVCHWYIVHGHHFSFWQLPGSLYMIKLSCEILFARSCFAFLNVFFIIITSFMQCMTLVALAFPLGRCFLTMSVAHCLACIAAS